MPSMQSQPLSDSDILIVKGWFKSLVIASSLYGVYATFAVTAIYLTLFKKVSGSITTIALPLFTGFTLLTSLAFNVSTLEIIIQQLPLQGFNPPNLRELQSVLIKMLSIQFSTQRLNYIISDGIVVWRAWIMFPESRAVKLTLLFCMISSFTGGFVDVGLGVAQIVSHRGNKLSKFNTLILSIPLFVTNLIATLLIGYKTWYHYQDVKKNLDNSGTSSSKILKVLLLLIESGSMYCILWIVYTIIALKYDQASNLSQCWAAAVPQLSALYPVLIIVIAAAENAKPTTAQEMSLSQSIRFASGPGQADSSEEDMSMTEPQSNVPVTPMLTAEHTGGNST